MSLTLTVPSGTFHLSGNPLYVKITGASPPAGSTGYRVLCRVNSTDGLLEGAPFTDARAPDGAGEALFDMSGYCDQPLDKSFDYPLTGGLVPYNQQTLDVTFTPGESYIDSGGNLQETWGTSGEGHFVVGGGVGPGTLGRYRDSGTSFYQEYVTGGRFLTHMPSGQRVHPFQPAKLWLLAPQSGDHDLRIKAWYQDGSSYQYSSSHTFYRNIMHEINCLPCHADSLHMPPVKTGGIRMTHYEVWIEGVTGPYRFEVDHGYHPQCHFLFFFNSLGGLDVVWLHGEVVRRFRTGSQVVSSPFPREGRERDRTLLVASRTGQRMWKINTGWKSREEMASLQDLLLSREAWMLEDAGLYNGGTLVPVTVVSGTQELWDTQKDLCSLDLELEEAHNNPYL